MKYKQNFGLNEAATQIDSLYSLAVMGRHGVVNCGALVFSWAVAIVAGAGIEMFENHRVLSVVAWIGPLFLAFLTSVIIIRDARSRPNGLTWRTQAIHCVWMATGASILFFNIGEDIRGGQLPSQSEAMTAFSLAVALLITANVSGHKAFGTAGLLWMLVAFCLLTIIPPPLLLPTLLVSGLLLLGVAGWHTISSEGPA